jgi:hypothetical protein
VGAQIVEIPRTEAMLDALDRVIAVAEETDDNATFEEPVREFWDAFFAGCDARGLCHRYTPSVVLVWLELALIADESLPVDRRINYAAAVATIRQALESAQREQARWN